MTTTNTTVSASVRSILVSLQNAASTIATTQSRLATGKKVASAMDDASAYYTSRNLYNRADDLSPVKDNIMNGLNVVKAATQGLDAIEKVLVQMKGLATQAAAATTVADRATYAAQYDALRGQLDKLATDSSFNGINLLKATPDSLTVNLNETGTASLTVAGVASDSAGLAVTASNSWNNATLATGLTNIQGDSAKIDAALSTVRTTSATLGSNSSLLQIRADFTSSLINTLKAGGDNLTNADMNEESANMLALQTRQQLAIQSLTMANQSSQAVLRLFG